MLCNFRKRLSDFGKVLQIHFVSTWNNLLKHSISLEFLLIEGLVQGTLWKELLAVSFVKRFNAVSLIKSYRYIFPVLVTIYWRIPFLLNFADGKLSRRCCTKGAAHYSFCRALYNSYFGKALLRDFANSWNNLLKHCTSAEYLLIQGYVQGALRKELFIAPFVEHFKITTLGKSQWLHLSMLQTKMTKHCIFPEVFLIES